MGLWSGLAVGQRVRPDMRGNRVCTIYIEDRDKDPRETIFEFSTYNEVDERKLIEALEALVHRLNRERPKGV